MSIGDSEPRHEGLAKLRGDARYPADLGQPGDLVLRVVFSEQPHARMRSLDTRDAEAMAGVVAVFTARDVPRNEYGLVRRDQPVLIGPAPGDGGVPADVSRWEGDHIAIIVAENADTARRGAAALRVQWEELPVVADIDAAKRDTVLVHPESPARSNIYHRLELAKGLPDEGWRSADTTVESSYIIGHQEHAYLQPEAARSYLDDQDQITIEVAGQWAHGDRAQIANALDLPEERIRVRYPTIGGAFGGREDVSLQIVMALATWRLSQRGERRPLRCVWSREESIIGHGKGHWMHINSRLGATSDGELCALDATVELDAGAYNYTSDVLLQNTLSFLGGPYDIPHVRLEGRAIHTNNVPGAAFRGFGAPQACFAAEGQMNKLAAALGMDPLALRRANILRPTSRDVVGAPLPEAIEIQGAIDACSRAIRAQAPRRIDELRRPANAFSTLPPDRRALRVGRGFACGFKNIGYSFGHPERSEVTLELHGDHEIEKVVLRHAGAEVGQGAHTVLRQMAAAALDVASEAIELVATDTKAAGDAGSSSASRLTVMAGNAIRQAAERARENWEAGKRPAFGETRFEAKPTAPLGNAALPSHVSYGAVAEAVELSVDIETGHVSIERIICVDDLGRVINPTLARGQIEGALAQAQGGALSERLSIVGGRIANPRFSEYLIPAIGDVPEEVEIHLLEHADPSGPWGARGLGEMPFLPLAAAITAALFDATGVWFDEIPVTPERVYAALNQREIRRAPD